MKKILTPTNEDQFKKAYDPKASPDDVKKFLCSCVNHLCGCK